MHRGEKKAPINFATSSSGNGLFAGKYNCWKSFVIYFWSKNWQQILVAADLTDKTLPIQWGSISWTWNQPAVFFQDLGKRFHLSKKTFFTQDKYCHLPLCLCLMEPNGHSFSAILITRWNRGLNSCQINPGSRLSTQSTADTWGPKTNFGAQSVRKCIS